MSLKIKNLFLIFSVVIFQSVLVQAEVLFEGYYKVSQFKKHVGFYILKYEVDSKKNEFKTTTFLKLAKNGLDLTESLQATSTLDFKPLNYIYMATDGKKSTTIDATFKDSKMSGWATESGVKKKLSGTLPKGCFLSSSVYYMILSSKEGLKTGVNFEFTAIDEYTASISKGSAKIDNKMVSEGALQLLRVENKFAGTEYENLITAKGENYSAKTPATGIDTVLVKNSEEAIQDIKVAKGVLEKIFGRIPEGKTNILNTK